MPRKPGWTRSSAASRDPLPPPTSTTVSSPLHSSEASCSTRPLAPSCIGAVECRAFVRVVGEPRPEVGSEVARERHLAGRVQSGDRAVPDAAEQRREVSPASADEQLGGRGIAKGAWRVLGEDTVARKRPQQAVERVRIRAGLPCQLGDGPRSVGEPVRDPELRDDGQRAGAERAAHQVPQLSLGSGLAHARAARTAAATASTSASETVRQSRSSLPSRTTPITGGSPSRSGAASSSSTAHA